VPTRIPASERTSQKLEELLTQGVARGDARTELLKLAVRKIVEEARDRVHRVCCSRADGSRQCQCAARGWA
jgi:hypothetical protein